MKEIRNDFYNESIFKETLDNGLTVYLMPKKGYSQYSAIFMTNYGSFDTTFTPIDEDRFITTPEGIAHFLEHKMFETPSGGDVNDLFSSMGVEANAYTSYDRTAYTIFGTGNANEAVELLIDFVQTPSFSKESIEKERSIIEQELLMYLDNAKTVSKVRFLKSLYGEDDKIAKEIGGTVESIKEIDKDILMKCYNTFYHPANMTLVVVGGFDKDELIDMIRLNQSNKTFAKFKEIKKPITQYVMQKEEVIEKSYFNIDCPIVTVGFKFEYINEDETLVSKKAFAYDFLFDLYFSGFSTFTEKLRKNGLGEIDPIYSVTYYSGYGFFSISATTNKYQEFTNLVKSTLDEAILSEVNSEKVKSIKRGIHTNNIKRFNSVQGLCNDLAELHFKNLDLFESIEVPNQVTLEDIKLAQESLKDYRLCIHLMLPNNE